MSEVHQVDDKELLLHLQGKDLLLADKDGMLVVQSPAVGEIANATRRERDARVSELVQRTGL